MYIYVCIIKIQVCYEVICVSTDCCTGMLHQSFFKYQCLLADYSLLIVEAFLEVIDQDLAITTGTDGPKM